MNYPVAYQNTSLGEANTTIYLDEPVIVNYPKKFIERVQLNCAYGNRFKACGID